MVVLFNDLKDATASRLLHFDNKPCTSKWPINTFDFKANSENTIKYIYNRNGHFDHSHFNWRPICIKLLWCIYIVLGNPYAVSYEIIGIMIAKFLCLT